MYNGLDALNAFHEGNGGGLRWRSGTACRAVRDEPSRGTSAGVGLGEKTLGRGKSSERGLGLGLDGRDDAARGIENAIVGERLARDRELGRTGMTARNLSPGPEMTLLPPQKDGLVVPLQRAVWRNTGEVELGLGT